MNTLLKQFNMIASVLAKTPQFLYIVVVIRVPPATKAGLVTALLVVEDTHLLGKVSFLGLASGKLLLKFTHFVTQNFNVLDQ